MGDVVKETLFTKDMEEMKANMGVRKAFYPDGQYPAASWVQINRLFMPDSLVEVEVMAYLGEKDKN
ncbi:RidA family protein [Aliiglaciecola sp. CAU 1673]|uniref:RidA family protein n=1 Tax=Aliiglaciecola sp. CAU 1673 TaxID=3032595 RepID=UPI0023DADFF4|nr:RidA family protein [Aliiglaciecola sp. CAU 1673]MDF2179379.1 RidA family protein [Aliiglaciecola sp. CAU 1673]